MVKPDDPRLNSDYITYNSPKGGGSIRGLFSKPVEAKNKLPREAEPRISICFVKNSYREGDNWNYNDQANTFERIKEIN